MYGGRKMDFAVIPENLPYMMTGLVITVVLAVVSMAASITLYMR